MAEIAESERETPATRRRWPLLPSQNFPSPDELPWPTRRIFYDCRAADVADDLPRIEGYWRGDAYVFGTLLAALVGRRAPAGAGASGANSLSPRAKF